MASPPSHEKWARPRPLSSSPDSTEMASPALLRLRQLLPDIAKALSESGIDFTSVKEESWPWLPDVRAQQREGRWEPGEWRLIDRICVTTGQTVADELREELELRFQAPFLFTQEETEDLDFA